MIAPLRVVTIAAGVSAVWVIGASQIPTHERLPVAGIVAGAVISQPFGCTSFELEPYDPFCPGRHIHTGVDLAAPLGSAVHSASSGIAHAGVDPNGAGNFVMVVADPHVRVYYCHLSAIGVVNGQTVNAGQVIGALGESGRATGPHVHFEVQVDGTSVDPVAWLAS
jgi:murein DD-endopeptidase MepM/ murein hydrolase activator NlpD